MKKVKLFEQFINENSAWAKANKKAEDLFGEFGIASLDDSQLADIIDIKKADKLADKMFGEFGFSSLSEDEMEELLTKNPKILKESLNEGKWSKIMTGVKKGAKSGPWAIVVIKDGKVVSQTQVEVMDAIPAFYEDVKKQYPNAKIRIEDNEGMIVYNESVVTEAIKVKELDTLIDVLANLEDAFTEEEFVEFGVVDLDMQQSTMMDIWDTYWNLSPQERLRYSTQDWAKWLKKNHSVI